MTKIFFCNILTVLFISTAIGQTSVPTQTPPLPATTPTLAPAPNTIEEQLKRAQEENDKKIKAIADKLAKLEGELQKGTIDDKFASLSQKVEALEKLNLLKKQSSVINDEGKYKAGLETLDTIIGNVRKLNFAKELTTSVDRIQSITNPSTNDAFLTEIRSLKGDKLNLNNSGLEAIAGPLLSNPYISLAWSIGSTLISNFKKEEKPAKLNRMICVIDAATRTETDMRIIRSDLSTLGERMKKFEDENLTLFEDYTSAVGRKMSYDEYKANGDPDGPMTTPISTFFGKYKGDSITTPDVSTSNEIAVFRYRLDKAKSSLNEYDGIMKQTDAFLAKFAEMLEKQMASVPDCPAITSLKLDLGDLKKKSVELRPAFIKAFTRDVKPAWRNILFVVN